MNKKGAKLLGSLFAVIALAYLLFLIAPQLLKAQTSSLVDTSFYREITGNITLGDFIIAIVFAFLGFFMFCWGLFRKHPSLAVNTDKKPWLANPEWQGGPIYSEATTLLTKLLRWKKSSRTPLYLDPFPGAIGGNFGGYVEINREHRAGAKYKVSISCLQKKVKSPGKNSAHTEKLLWQEAGIGDANGYQQRTRVKFRFDIPKGLKQTDIGNKNECVAWRFHIECSSPKSKINRRYEVPVYTTGELSKIQYPLSKNKR